MERKEWKTLYMINKQIYFAGFKPLQWVMLSCILFMAGWFAWWLAVVLLIPAVYAGRGIARQVSAGNPDPLTSLIVRLSMRKYFIDREIIFKKL